jgi:hypothetical protein
LTAIDGVPVVISRKDGRLTIKRRAPVAPSAGGSPPVAGHDSEAPHLSAAEHGGDPASTAAELARLGLTMDDVSACYRYYLYSSGLPMKLADPEATPAPEARLSSFAGRPALALEVYYGASGDSWTYFFDPDSARLLGGASRGVADPWSGIRVEFDGEAALSSMRIPRTRTWRDAAGAWLGSDVVTKAQKLGD